MSAWPEKSTFNPQMSAAVAVVRLVSLRHVDLDAESPPVAGGSST
jgi:hypothetical protein